LLTNFSIGGACAEQFARAGAHLALTYASNRDSMEKLVTELKNTYSESGLRISLHQVDVSVEESIDNLFKEIKEQHGGAVVDILVSNAGYGKRITGVW